MLKISHRVTGYFKMFNFNEWLLYTLYSSDKVCCNKWKCAFVLIEANEGLLHHMQVHQDKNQYKIIVWHLFHHQTTNSNLTYSHQWTSVFKDKLNHGNSLIIVRFSEFNVIAMKNQCLRIVQNIGWISPVFCVSSDFC